MKAEAIVIQRPERQRPVQRVLFGFITVIAWVIWASLWLPLLTALAWAIGLGDIYVQLDLGHPLQSSGDLDIVLYSALVCVAIFTSWSAYNHLRFSGKQKRRGNSPVSTAETAKAIGASLDTALIMQAQRRSVVQFTEKGFMSVTRAPLAPTLSPLTPNLSPDKSGEREQSAQS